jgi:hypothetical protein
MTLSFAGPYALVGKGLQETYIMHELTDPPQPGPEQQALALCQIDGKVASFKIMVKVDRCNEPVCNAARSVPAVHCMVLVQARVCHALSFTVDTSKA